MDQVRQCSIELEAAFPDGWHYRQLSGLDNLGLLYGWLNLDFNGTINGLEHGMTNRKGFFTIGNKQVAIVSMQSQSSTPAYSSKNGLGNQGGVTVPFTWGLSCFFATQWIGSVNSDLTYFVTPEGSYCSQKRSQNIVRESFEIENFTIQFLKNAFEHNEYTYQSNLLACLQVMDKKSGLFLKSKYNEEEVFQVYKTYNGVSILSIEQIHTNLMDYPYEVVAFYTTTLQFLGLEGKKLSGADHKELAGGVYFKLKTTHRSKENLYELLISEFCFVDPKNKDAYVQNNR